eukprot:14092367-Alexandrium_andersonii.AAC.1
MSALVLYTRVCARWSTCALALHARATAPRPEKLSFRRACAGAEVALTPEEAAGGGASCARHGGHRAPEGGNRRSCG